MLPRKMVKKYLSVGKSGLYSKGSGKKWVTPPKSKHPPNLKK